MKSERQRELDEFLPGVDLSMGEESVMISIRNLRFQVGRKSGRQRELDDFLPMVDLSMGEGKCKDSHRETKVPGWEEIRTAIRTR